MGVWTVVSSLVLLSVSIGCIGAPTGRIPIIIVPGIVGSQLEAIHNPDVHYPFYCPAMHEWQTIWISLSDVLPYRLSKCLLPDLSFKFNASTSQYDTLTGIRIRPRNFGKTEGIEYLDPNPVFAEVTKYFAPFVNFLVNELGYERGKTVFGAPYDWRLSPWHTNFNNQLTALVEMVSATNNNSPVIIVSHSMGGPVMQNFFTHSPQGWKDKYIRMYFSIDGAFYGAPKVVLALTSGDSFHLPLRARDLVFLERTFESPLFLMPNITHWPKDQETVLITDRRNYTIHDFEQILNDLNVTDGKQKLEILRKGWSKMDVPGVETHCVYGYGLKTPAAYVYHKLEGASEPDEVIYTDGDGTVPIHSLRACEDWQGKQKQNVTMRRFLNVEHVQAIKDPEVFKYFVQVLDTL